jgi:hypothetical protein
MVVVMVGDEVMGIATMAGAVAARSAGEVTTVRPVTGRKAGANLILTRLVAASLRPFAFVTR